LTSVQRNKAIRQLGRIEEDGVPSSLWWGCQCKTDMNADEKRVNQKKHPSIHDLMSLNIYAKPKQNSPLCPQM